jgi:hypothetical protein
MAKLKDPLLFSTARDRSIVYGHGTSSNNEPCEIESFNEDLLTPEICMVCATTRFDPLLPYIGNVLGHGRDYYKQYCTREQDFDIRGSTGFISRGPALYGLYLAKVNAFYEEHTDHVVYATGEVNENGTLFFNPLVLHISFWGKDLEYPSYIMTIAEQLIAIRETQIENGEILSYNNLTTTQKNLTLKIIEFLETQDRWEERKIAFTEWRDTSNQIGTKNIDSLLPQITEIDILDDSNLDDFFSSDSSEIPF